MKKTIIILGLALVTFTGTANATTVSTNSTTTEILDFDNSPLCNAILKGDFATVKKFVEYGANVNETSNGLTPLMFAARYNRTDIITFLLEKGADKSTKDEKGNTAAKYAENSKSMEALELLKRA